MDLPNCPACGEPLRLESPHGPARCGSCGFRTPVELDAGALGDLLEETRARGLGPQPLLRHAREAPDLRLGTDTPPSMLETSRPAEVPTLSPPPAPPELAARAPPRPEDPRATLSPPGEDGPSTTLASDLEGRRDARRRELGPRGELLR